MLLFFELGLKEILNGTSMSACIYRVRKRLGRHIPWYHQGSPLKIALLQDHKHQEQIWVQPESVWILMHYITKFQAEYLQF